MPPTKGKRPTSVASDERNREAIAVQRDGDGVGDGEGAEGGVAAGEESPPVGDRLTHRP